jgi:hypothetical protein
MSLPVYVNMLENSRMYVFTSEGKVFFLRACGKFIVVERRSQIRQNVNGSKHIAAVVVLKLGYVDWRATQLSKFATLR